MNPELLEMPAQLETERLIIRPPHVGEGAIVNEAILESLAELKPWMPWAAEAPSVEDTECNIRRAIARTQLREDIRLQFHLKDGTFVGSSGLHRIDWSVPKFEIGYWVRTRFVGKGYVTEAVAAIANLAFASLGANRVEIICDSRNLRSRAIPERLHFPLEGILRSHKIDHHNTLRDTCIYARTKSV
jgi:RimJ/RimL family protein N-acetyltransferase